LIKLPDFVILVYSLKV